MQDYSIFHLKDESPSKDDSESGVSLARAGIAAGIGESKAHSSLHSVQSFTETRAMNSLSKTSGDGCSIF